MGSLLLLPLALLLSPCGFSGDISPIRTTDKYHTTIIAITDDHSRSRGITVIRCRGTKRRRKWIGFDILGYNLSLSYTTLVSGSASPRETRTFIQPRRKATNCAKSARARDEESRPDREERGRDRGVRTPVDDVAIHS